MTDAEIRLWRRIRGKQILGLQFNRQKPLLNYIVDFYCASVQLVIELDGGQHYDADAMQADVRRDKALAEAGLLVLRFENSQVLKETDKVLEEIYHVVEQRIQYD